MFCGQINVDYSIFILFLILNLNQLPSCVLTKACYFPIYNPVKPLQNFDIMYLTAEATYHGLSFPQTYFLLLSYFTTIQYKLIEVYQDNKTEGYENRLSYFFQMKRGLGVIIKKYKIGQVRLGQVRLGQVSLGQVRLGQVRLSQVRFSMRIFWFCNTIDPLPRTLSPIFPTLAPLVCSKHIC